jgi:hypothetical protein
MRVGDLVIVKKGSPPEGQVGVVLTVGAVGVAGVGGVFGGVQCDVLFPEGVKNLSGWWLEPLEVPDANR